MTSTFRAVVLTVVVIASASLEARQAPQNPAPGPPPATPSPGAQAPAAPPAAVAVPPIPTAPTASVARAFTTGCGFLLHPVRPERVQDFERFLAYVRDALARSTNPRVRSQAGGWRFFKASEPGPNGVALYVFWIDPAVQGADYQLGPILAEVYTDPAQLTEIWALYQSSVTSGGTLLNLSPVPLAPPQPIVTPPVNAPTTGQKPAAQPPAAVTPPPAAPAAKPVTPAPPQKC